jgi:hypothetical protein
MGIKLETKTETIISFKEEIKKKTPGKFNELKNIIIKHSQGD